MSGSTNIIERSLNITLEVQKLEDDCWSIYPTLTAGSSPIIHNFVFVLDCSHSMNKPINNDSQTTLMDLVKHAMKELLKKLPRHSQFSIILFENSARYLENNNTEGFKHFSVDLKNNIRNAMMKIDSITAGGDTCFTSAFKMIHDQRLLNTNFKSTIIFLSDSEGDLSKTDEKSPEELIKLMTSYKHLGLFEANEKIPSIIPIAIVPESKHDNANQRSEPTTLDFLAKLAKLSTNGRVKEPIIIRNNNPATYTQAFEHAVDLAVESSQYTPILEVSLISNGPPGFNTHPYKKKLENPIDYDGKTPVGKKLTYTLSAPPKSCEVNFIVDGYHIKAKHIFKDEELPKNQGEIKRINIDQFKWKNDTTISWLKCLGKIALGLILIAGFVTFGSIVTPSILSILLGLNFIAHTTGLIWGIGILGSLMGVLVVCNGITDLLNKTVSWKAKRTEPSPRLPSASQSESPSKPPRLQPNNPSQATALKNIGQFSHPLNSENLTTEEKQNNELNTQPARP